MTRFLVIRLSQSLVLVLVFVALSWLLIQLQPGDAASAFVGAPNFTGEDRENIRAALGLDRPLWQQFFVYMGNFFQAEFGVSFTFNKPVIEVLLERAPRTIFLFLVATVVSFYLGFVVGKAVGWSKNRTVDITANISAVYTFTLYTPWFALMMILLFGTRLDWFPSAQFISTQLWRRGEYASNDIFFFIILSVFLASLALVFTWYILSKYRVSRAFIFAALAGLTVMGVAVFVWQQSGILPFAWDIIWHTMLPVIMLTVISFAGTLLLTRSSMLETLGEDYVLVARAKGLAPKTVRDKYVARNAILPVVTSLVISLAVAIDGGVITETIFSWPGLGLTLIEAVTMNDLPLAVGAFLFIGIFALIAHIVADILYSVLDPRIRVG